MFFYLLAKFLYVMTCVLRLVESNGVFLLPILLDSKIIHLCWVVMVEGCK